MEIITPILTPFKNNGDIDKEALKTHVNNLITKGIDLIFLNGSTGLGPALSKDEKLSTLKTIYDTTGKIIFQVGGLNINEVIELLKASKEYDIVGVASYSPFYFPRIPEKMLIKYFKTIEEYSPHPIYIYNYPLATGYDISAKTLEKFMDSKFVGIKDTNQDLSHSLEYKSLKNFKVYNGSDSLIYYSLLSLDGSVTAASNYLPEIVVKMKNLIQNGKLNEALELQKLIISILEISRKYGQLSSNYLLVREFQGYNVGIPRGPIFPLEDEDVKALIQEINPLKDKIKKFSS